MPELDAMNPEMGPENNPDQVIGTQQGEVDHEGAMAKADLYKLANYSYKLFKKMDDNDQLEAWVQAKITKAADYIASVYHYLEYEMEFSEYGAKLENSEIYSESQKIVLKNKLMEAKEKIKALKVSQAEKIKEGAIMGGHEETCHECGGSGVIQMPERDIPETVKGKVEKYNRKAKAMHAASKRIDRNKNGIPDDMENDQPVDEETSSTGGEITRGKGFTRHSHNPARFSDEPHAEPASKAKSKSAAEKSGEKAADKQTEKDSKDWSKRFGKDSVTKVSAGKKEGGEKKEKAVDETYGQGVYESEMKVGATKKTRTGVLTKTASGVKHTNTSFKDEEHAEPASKVKSRSAAEKSGEKAADKAAEKESKAYEKAHPGTVSRYKDGKKVNEAAKEKEPEGTYSKKRFETDGQRVARLAKEKMQAKKKAEQKVDEALKGKQKNLDQDKDGDIEADDLAALRAKKKSKTESYVQKAIAEAKKKANGKKPDFLDMDKDGDKEEPMKKAIDDKKEVVKESADLARMRELSGRLNLNENVIVKQSNEVDELRALTKRLLG